MRVLVLTVPVASAELASRPALSRSSTAGGTSSGVAGALPAAQSSAATPGGPAGLPNSRGSASAGPPSLFATTTLGGSNNKVSLTIRDAEAFAKAT